MKIQLINISQLSEKLGGRSKASLYRDVSAGALPRPIKLSGSVYWDEAQVEAHIMSLIDASSSS